MRTLYTILRGQFDQLVLHRSANVGNEADMLKSYLDFSFGVAWSRRNTRIGMWGLV